MSDLEPLVRKFIYAEKLAVLMLGTSSWTTYNKQSEDAYEALYAADPSCALALVG